MSKKNKSKKNKCKSHVQRDCEVLKEDKNGDLENDKKKLKEQHSQSTAEYDNDTMEVSDNKPSD